jgi:hypothetical protein
VFLGKVGSDLQKPDGLVVITNDDLPGILLGLQLQDIYGIGKRMEQRLHRAGIVNVEQLWKATPFQLRRVWGGDYYCRRLGVHRSWVGDLGDWWDETDFHETRDTGFLLARLEEVWKRVPRHKPLSVGVVLLDLVPADQHQPDLFAADNHRRQKLSPLIDRINDRYGRYSIGFGLFPRDVRALEGHAAFHRVPEKWEF